MRKCIVIEGPPGSGKDTLGAFLRKELRTSWQNVVRIKASDKLKMAVHFAYNLVYPNLTPFEPEYFDNVKDVINIAFGGLTPREAYIDFSEHYMKSRMGHSFYGRCVTEDFQAATKGAEDAILITEGGFREEVQQYVSRFPEGNCLFIKIFRPDCSFDDDSRYYSADYFSVEHMLGNKFRPIIVEVHNDSSIAEFLGRGLEVVERFLEGRRGAY